MATKQEKVDELKGQGNDCVKAGNYNEAVLHYSHAIQVDGKNKFLHSNRSLAFLKVQQYYFAYEDAKTTIKLDPTWPKGYFRKGEVESQVGQFSSALLSYGQAHLLDRTNKEVEAALLKTGKELDRRQKIVTRQPWLFIGGGLLLGLLLVLADQFLAEKPSIQYFILQILLILVFGGIGFISMKVYRYMSDTQKTSLLEPPIDLLGEMEKEGQKAENEKDQDGGRPSEHRPHRKGGMGAARQRYKKGKS